MKILNAAEMREVDRLTTSRHRVPSLTLMENAGKGIAEFIQRRFTDFARRRLVILCGKGGNGGDGFVAARHLRKMGAKPVVHLVGDPRDVKGEVLANMRRWKAGPGKIQSNPAGAKAAWGPFTSDLLIIDALLGTGSRGTVEGQLREAIEAINGREAGCVVVSVDIPSGLNADTGEVSGVAVRADYTITFTAPKPGLFLGKGPDCVGQLTVYQVGSPPSVVEETGKGNLRWSESGEFSGFALPREPDGNKGVYGHALVVAGSVGKSGAAVLASWAALRAGAGLVTVAVPEPILPIVAAHTPEIMTEALDATSSGSISMRSIESDRFASILKGKRALAIGPGLTTHDETQQAVRAIVGKRAVPIILDADGLNAFAGRAAELKHGEGNICLTPHPGEMARLAGCKIADVQSRRIDLALKSAADWNAIVVLKGYHTVVAAPGGRAYVNSTGNPGMATGGTGDVLTGILAGLTAQFGAADWLRVIAFGVYLHGLAADIAYAESGGAPLMASDLIRALPRAYQRFYAESGRA